MDLSIPSRASVVNIITYDLTFKAGNDQSISLIQRAQSLQQSLSVSLKDKHLVNASGYLLPDNDWDPLNLGYFFEHNSLGTLNQRPATRVGDILSERSSVDHLTEVVRNGCMFLSPTSW